MAANGETSLDSLNKFISNFLFDQLCIIAIISMICAINMFQSVGGPANTTPDSATNHKYIKLFSELCSDDLPFDKMTHKISRILDEVFDLFCDQQPRDKFSRHWRLDWTELRSMMFPSTTILKTF